MRRHSPLCSIVSLPNGDAELSNSGLIPFLRAEGLVAKPVKLVSTGPISYGAEAALARDNEGKSLIPGVIRNSLPIVWPVSPTWQDARSSWPGAIAASPPSPRPNKRSVLPLSGPSLTLLFEGRGDVLG